MEITNKAYIIAAGVIICTAIFGAVIICFQLVGSLEKQQLVDHSYIVISKFQGLVSSLKDAETGARGYVITGNSTYLEPYNLAINQINNDYNELTKLTADNNNQQMRLANLQPLITERLSLLSQDIPLRTEIESDSAKANSLLGNGKQIMDNIRKIIGDATSEEQNLLDKRNKETTQANNFTILLVIIVTIVIIIVTILMAFLLKSSTKSELKERTKAIQSTEQLEKIKFALDESSLVAITDKNGTITYVNKKFCEVSEYTQEELIGQNHRILKSGFHNPEFYEDLWKTISSGRTWYGEIKNVSKHGKYYWVKTTIVPQLDDKGKPEQYIAIRTEITDRKNAEDELIEANKTIIENEKFRTQARILEETTKAKDQFAAMMSHEIKTPIIPITGYAELLLDGTLGTLTDNQKEKIQIIYENSTRMTRLIQDMIDSYRMGLNKLKLDMKEIGCNEIINQCMDSFKPLAEKQGIQLNNKSKDVLITCDPNRIQQVLNNLISNALKYVPPQQGIITVSTKLDDNYLVFTVQDNGTGIPKDKQSNLFHPFYQADTSLTRKSGGTGLGLSISKGLVELHGGKIWIESEEGKGSAFHFTIPTRIKN